MFSRRRAIGAMVGIAAVCGGVLVAASPAEAFYFKTTIVGSMTVSFETTLHSPDPGGGVDTNYAHSGTATIVSEETRGDNGGTNFTVTIDEWQMSASDDDYACTWTMSEPVTQQAEGFVTDATDQPDYAYKLQLQDLSPGPMISPVCSVGESLAEEVTIRGFEVRGHILAMPLNGPTANVSYTGIKTAQESYSDDDYTENEILTTDADLQALDATTKPWAPVIGVATGGTTGSPVNATARWSAPSNDGGAPITAYKVQAQKLNASGRVVQRFNFTRAPASRELTMVLPLGRYKFRVAAVNFKGASVWSANSNIVRAR